MLINKLELPTSVETSEDLDLEEKLLDRNRIWLVGVYHSYQSQTVYSWDKLVLQEWVAIARRNSLIVAGDGEQLKKL